jgi:hypothetical protein
MTHPTRWALLALFAAVAGCGDTDGADDASTTTSPQPAPPASSRPEGVALCYSDLSRGHVATAGFYATLSAGDRGARAQAIGDLTAAATEHPGEEQFALLLGLAYLWRIAEPLPDESGNLALSQKRRPKREPSSSAPTLCAPRIIESRPGWGRFW